MPAESLIGSGPLGEDRFIAASGGRRLRTMLAGRGDDLIVLEAGLGASGLYWGPVHTAIASRARVVAYERAGFGASSPAGTQVRDLVHLADDLQCVIDAIPHRRLVLVGHSWGGPIVRTLASRLLTQGRTVTGLVLVDQSDEHAADLYVSRIARWSDAIQNALMVPLARLRILAPLMKTQLVGLSQPLLDTTLAASSSVDAARAISAENRHVGRELQRLRDHPLTLGDLGISVISGQKHTRVDRAIRARLVAAHRDTVSEHPGAHFVAAQRSGHMIPITEPALIATEALAFLDAPTAQDS